MKYSIKVNQTQAQRIYMSETMKQGVEILQMNIEELEQLIENEASENPLLEIEYPEQIDWQGYLQDISSKKMTRDQREFDNEFNPSNFIERPLSLLEHMSNELSYLALDEKEKRIALYIVENIDENGYFVRTMDDALRQTGVNEEFFYSVLQKVQTIEPLGLAARDLRECLLLQLGEENQLANAIIQNDLELLARGKYLQLSKKYETSKQEIREVEALIKSLNPYPGKNFSSAEVKYIIPDMTLEIAENSLQVRRNQNYPRLSINSFYQELLLGTDDEEAKEYIKDRLNKAVNVIRNIERRENTLQKVTEEIIEFQSEFFLRDDASLVPMKLADIAEKSGFHPSTISRATRGKYILTPRGLFELKNFFVSEIKTQEGVVSGYFVKEKIREIIEQEDKRKPLSDQKICDILSAQGIQIARRTITKYREAQKIPKGSYRKRK